MPGYTQHDGARACPSCGAENTEGTKFCHECGGAMEAEAAPAADPLLGQTILDRYKIVSELGEGGMGKVYRAEQKMGNATRFVAIKTLHPELSRDPQIVARFLRESETVIQLTHPNTIQFYDFGELPDKTLFIVMEYIEGESLAHTLLRGAIEPTRVDKLLVQICGSLNEAHGLGIVHRDLKPDNILLTNRGGQTDFVKVLDFGIAKRSEAEDQKDAKLTKQGMVLGTPPYMSPEQFSGVALDARSDIYSLGLITYEMLTGELPFMARTPWEWATQHLTVQPTPLDRHPVAELLPPHKRAAVMRALEKDRSNRQPSVLDFMREFTGATDAQAAWAAVTSAAGAATTSTSDPNSRTPTGAVVRKAVGTPEAMPQTNELDFAEAGLPGARSSGAGSRAAVIIGLCAAVGAVAGAAWFFLGDKSNADAVAQTQASANTQTGTNGTETTTVPSTPSAPTTETGDDTNDDGTKSEDSTAASTKENSKSSSASSKKKSGSATTGTGTSTGDSPGGTPPSTTQPSTPSPSKPEPILPAAPDPTPAPTPSRPSVPAAPAGGWVSAPAAPTSGGSHPATPVVTTAKPATAARPGTTYAAPAAPGVSQALIDAGTKAAQAGDFGTAAKKLTELQRSDKAGAKQLQTVIAREGYEAVTNAIRRGDCAKAQSIFKQLRSMGADSLASGAFNASCPKP